MCIRDRCTEFCQVGRRVHSHAGSALEDWLYDAGCGFPVAYTHLDHMKVMNLGRIYFAKLFCEEISLFLVIAFDIDFVAWTRCV